MRLRDVLSQYPMDQVVEEVIWVLGYREGDDCPDTGPIVEVVEKLLASSSVWSEELLLFGHLKLRWMFICPTASVYSFRDVMEFAHIEAWEELSIEASPGLASEESPLLWRMTEAEMTELLKIDEKRPLSMKDVPLEQLSGAIVVGSGLLDPACAVAEYLVGNGLMDVKPLDDYIRKLAEDDFRNYGIDTEDPLNDMRRHLYERWEQYREIMEWRGRMARAYMALRIRAERQKEKEQQAEMKKGEADGV